MTKTPEELTEEWLNNKLQTGSFWFVEIEDDSSKPMVVDIDGDFDDYNGNYYWPCFSKGKLKVLAPVPTYDEYKAMKEKIKELEDRIAELEKENKQLEEDTGYGWHTAGIESDKNDKLRALLRECVEYIKEDIEFREDEDAMYCRDILTRINAALGDNKIQANLLDCNKIQESEEK